MSPSPVPTRAEYESARGECLSRGGARNPDVWRVAWAGRELVVKDFAARGALVRATIGRFITGREARAWKALSGHADVPAFVGRIDALAFAVEYRPGRYLSRSVDVDAAFVPRLEAAILEMHARGVAHLDLKHRDNVLVGGDGRPVLIDFGSAVVFEPRGIGARLLLPWFAAIDRLAIRKWRDKLGTREERDPGGPSGATD